MTNKRNFKSLSKFIIGTSLLAASAGTSITVASCSTIDSYIGNDRKNFDKIQSFDLRMGKLPNLESLMFYYGLLQEDIPAASFLNFYDEQSNLIPLGALDTFSIVFKKSNSSDQTIGQLTQTHLTLTIVKKIYEFDLQSLATDINSLKYQETEVKEISCSLDRLIS